MLTIRVLPFGSQLHTTHDVPYGPFDVGRSPPTDGVRRCVVLGDPSVSRNHARIVEEGAGQVRVTNTSQRMGIVCSLGTIGPGESRVLALPTTFKVGDTSVTVSRPPEEEGAVLHSMASLASSPLLDGRTERLVQTETDHDPAVVARWFETLIAVQRAPAGSKDFYAQTARSLVEQIGMDVGLVLQRKAGGWAVAARYSGGAADDGSGVRGREFSATVLDHVAREKRTIYQSADVPVTESLMEVKGLVASPVLLPNGEVAGALYGVRRTPHGRGVTISPLEAQMVQVLATAVGIGLARVAQEEETARLRVQLHQQFNDRLVRELETDLGRLDPQDREISILFADIRGFSRISERLGPAETFQFVSEVMEVMTESVKRHDGAIMDYVGDEMIAMWNAPADHPEHARFAVGCAAELSADLAGLGRGWETRLGEPVRIGVGVNSGMARVGNTGTKSKPKYGALGHAVNVASRVQGATKVFACTILLTAATRDRLPAGTAVRRLGRVKVVGIRQAVELFQPLTDPRDPSPDLVAGYAAALARFEAGELAKAREAVAALLRVPGASADGATRLLAARIDALVRTSAAEYAPVLELVSK